MRRKKAGTGQLDMILDGLEDESLASEYDRMIGVRDVHRCEICKRPITAEESRAFGIGHDCARDLGREVWAKRRSEREAAERGAEVSVQAVQVSEDLRTSGMSQVEMYALGMTDDPGVE